MESSTRTINFEKWEGAGNDFIVVEEALSSSLIQHMCDRHRGIGADGALVISDGQMRIFNSDGGEAEMCGNGLRIAYAYTRWDEIRVGGHVYRCSETERGIATTLTGAILRRGAIWLVDTGVPHAVAKAPSDLAALREREGANVTWYEVDGGLWVHTYERGVEAITLACGTGLAAAHLVAHAKGEVGPRTPLWSHSGDPFFSTIESDGTITLEGPATPVFSGKFFLDCAKVGTCKNRPFVCQ